MLLLRNEIPSPEIIITEEPQLQEVDFAEDRRRINKQKDEQAILNEIIRRKNKPG